MNLQEKQMQKLQDYRTQQNNNNFLSKAFNEIYKEKILKKEVESIVVKSQISEETELENFFRSYLKLNIKTEIDESFDLDTIKKVAKTTKNIKLIDLLSRYPNAWVRQKIANNKYTPTVVLKEMEKDPKNQSDFFIMLFIQRHKNYKFENSTGNLFDLDA